MTNPTCQWCGATMPPSRQPKRFCHAQHRAAFHEAFRLYAKAQLDAGIITIDDLKREVIQ